ncbi:MAG: 3-hydroxyacyl-CoA dehydrogenase [Cyclobacteriaceae bacterium]|nr:3-hydroxyacyl-CoA dehydrogenase [Cyclobacteriaceae bacterium]
MKILVIGDTQNNGECQQKFGAHHNWLYASSHSFSMDLLAEAEVIFDFNPNKTTLLNYQKGQPDLIVFLNTTLTTLAELLAGDQKADLLFFGFCGLPSFLNRDLMEVSVTHANRLTVLEEVCAKLNTKFECVADQVGLVTPRIICMIINEAYFTLEEGIATQSDIDLAMKLGTNYPYGPFEWAKRIGILNVYKVLRAMYTSTQDERYRISPLLKKEAEE